MDRHSSYIFIWLQLELCAMAVLLTKGGCPPAGGARAPRGGPRGPGALLAAGEAASRAEPAGRDKLSVLRSRGGGFGSTRPPRCPGAGRVEVV